MAKTAVLYARVSVFTEESVSIARQLDSCRKFAEARGWEVVGEFVDEGVSATKNKPEVREAWSALLVSEFAYDAVVIWKVDRLTRRVVDFMRAHEILTKRGAGIVCVEQTIDMTTPEGRAFAQMLAVFAELEAAAISSRCSAARRHMLAVGRAPGGRVAYGWRRLPNPDGPGFVFAQDPDLIDWVRQMVRRALRGDSLAEIVDWLNGAHAPLPYGARRRGDQWWHSSVERLLRNPLVAGMVSDNPGNPSGSEGTGVVLDAAGRPLVRKELAIISVAKRETLMRQLNKAHQRVRAGHAAAAATSRLMAGIARCGGCDRNMALRCGTSKGQPVMRCPACALMIAFRPLAAYVEHRLIQERGSLPMWGRDHTLAQTDGRELEAIEHQLEQAVRAFIEDRADTAEVTQQITALTQARTASRRDASLSGPARIVELGMTVEEVWRRCDSEEQRRRMLLGQIESLIIYRSHLTGRLDPARIDLRWRHSDDRPLAPAEAIGNPIGELVYDDSDRWISTREAVVLLEDSGVASRDPLNQIRRALREGHIEQRANYGPRPSVSRQSLLAFLEQHGTGREVEAPSAHSR